MERYCIFSAQYLPNLGGVERYTNNLAKELKKRNNEVLIVTSRKKDQEEIDVIDGIKIIRVNSFQALNGRLPISLPFSSWTRMLNKIDEYSPTRVIVQSHLYTLSILGLFYAKKRNIPSMMIDHGTSYVGVGNKIVQFYEKIYEKLMFALSKKTNIICSVSKAGEDWLKKNGLSCSGILYNSVNYNELKSLINDELHNLNNEQISKNFTVAYTGRLIKEKGVLQLLEAVKELNRSGRDVSLFIAGDGPLYNEIKNQSSNYVKVLGKIDQRSVVKLLLTSNVFCLPSDSEGFPTSVLEAAICECFVIATEYGGTKEIVISNDYGEILTNNDKETIMKSILNVMNLSDEEMRKKRKNILELVKNNFTWEKTCDKLEQVFSQR